MLVGIAHRGVVVTRDSRRCIGRRALRAALSPGLARLIFRGVALVLLSAPLVGFVWPRIHAASLPIPIATKRVRLPMGPADLHTRPGAAAFLCNCGHGKWMRVRAGCNSLRRHVNASPNTAVAGRPRRSAILDADDRARRELRSHSGPRRDRYRHLGRAECWPAQGAAGQARRRTRSHRRRVHGCLGAGSIDRRSAPIRAPGTVAPGAPAPIDAAPSAAHPDRDPAGVGAR